MYLFKIFLLLDYLIYTMLSYLPFNFGVNVRRLYFKFRLNERLGRNVVVGERVRIGSPSLITFQDDVSIMGNVILGYAIGGRIIFKKGALIGHDVTFINNKHEFKNKKVRIQDQGYILPHKDIIVGRNVWIGTRAIIMPGVTIGDYSIIGTGAIVTKSIPRSSIAAGVPAKVISKREHS